MHCKRDIFQVGQLKFLENPVSNLMCIITSMCGLKTKNYFINKMLNGEGSNYEKMILFGVSEGGTTAAKIATINNKISNLVIVGRWNKV